MSVRGRGVGVTYIHTRAHMPCRSTRTHQHTHTHTHTHTQSHTHTHTHTWKDWCLGLSNNLFSLMRLAPVWVDIHFPHKYLTQDMRWNVSICFCLASSSLCVCVRGGREGGFEGMWKTYQFTCTHTHTHTHNFEVSWFLGRPCKCLAPSCNPEDRKHKFLKLLIRQLFHSNSSDLKLEMKLL